MHRRQWLRHTGILAGAGLIFQQHALAALFRTAPTAIRMLRRNVGLFTQRGGTIGFFISPEGIVAIDSQFPDTAAQFLTEVKQQQNAPIRYLLNTHHHGDHTGGNIAFKGLVEHIVAHENALGHLKRVSESQNTLDRQLLPDQPFRDEVKLKIGNEKIKGRYFGAGHTNGDAVYHFEEANVAHLGDLLFNKRHPFVDRSAGADIASWIKVLGQIEKEFNKDTLYIFGHSLNPGEETGGPERLKRFADYLSHVLKFAETEYKRGVTLEAFIQNTAVPGVTEWSGDGLQRPLTAAYEEVAARK